MIRLLFLFLFLFAPLILLGAHAPDPTSGHVAKGRVLHVATQGSDGNSGSADRPFRTVQHAVDLAAPGDTIRVHAGTYDELVAIGRSGAPGSPIVLSGAGDGTATIVHTHRPHACSATSPTTERTIEIRRGADHWILRDLHIVGGVLVSGTNVKTLRRHLKDRTLPGRGSKDPESAKHTHVQLASDPADYIQVIDNDIEKRGFYAIGARFGVVRENVIHDIECSGPAVFLQTLTDFYEVKDNVVRRMEPSRHHYLNEGIRLTGLSMYSVVEGNVLEDGGGFARGIGLDVYASWNVIRENTVRRFHHGFSDEASTRGNQYFGNRSIDNRNAGFSIAPHMRKLREPDDRVPTDTVWECNSHEGAAPALRVGAVRRATFERNRFDRVILAPPVRGYWSRQSNTWDGKPEPPPDQPNIESFEACSG